MDLSTLDTSALANEGAVLELRGPDGNPVLQDDGSPVTITLLGEDSDVVTKHNNAIANQFLRSATGGPAITAEASKDNELSKLAKATVSWNGIVIDGEAVVCNEANAKALYRRFSWIRDQVRAFMGDRARFLPTSPKT